jgi:hypothetical protein
MRHLDSPFLGNKVKLFDADIFLQARRIQQQAAARQAMWQKALESRAAHLFVKAALLRFGHAVGNNAQTALMTGLLLFKV